MKRIIEIDATHWKCPYCGADHGEAFPFEVSISGQTVECAACGKELAVTDPVTQEMTAADRMADAVREILDHATGNLDNLDKVLRPLFRKDYIRAKRALTAYKAEKEGRVWCLKERIERCFPPDIVDMIPYLRGDYPSPTMSEIRAKERESEKDEWPKYKCPRCEWIGTDLESDSQEHPNADLVIHLCPKCHTELKDEFEVTVKDNPIEQMAKALKTVRSALVMLTTNKKKRGKFYIDANIAIRDALTTYAEWKKTHVMVKQGKLTTYIACAVVFQHRQYTDEEIQAEVDRLFAYLTEQGE